MCISGLSGYTGVQSFSELRGSISKRCLCSLSFLKVPEAEQNSFSFFIMLQEQAYFDTLRYFHIDIFFLTSYCLN